MLKTYFSHLETSVHLQAVTLNSLLISLAPVSFLNGLDKWVRGAPYATKWSEPHISVAVVSRGLRAGWCPVMLVWSIQTTSLWLNRPPRLFLSCFMNARRFVSQDRLHGAEGGCLSVANTEPHRHPNMQKEYGVFRQTCRYFIKP